MTFPAVRYPPELPITPRREEIIEAIRRHPVVILAGETGSGKTTQLPKMCWEAAAASGRNARGRIGCTQPRRVAAQGVSRRVAEELGVVWGREVGCKMRFQDDTGRHTRIKFMTDGILLAEIQGDPLLREYSTLILDEAHERSLNIDFLLGYLRGLLPRRPDLKLVVTSATIDTAAFSRHFDDAPIIEVSGRTYPVEIRHAPPREDADGEDDEPHHVEAAVAAVEELLGESGGGDLLVFMPTERDIRETCDTLAGRLGNGVDVLPLFGRMASADQQRIFTPGPKRRVVVATNVAETSITIPRIRFVVDTGLARISRYNPRTRTKRLPVEPVAQSSADQRAGRAGRVRDGVCVRLYTEADYLGRPRFATPEIQRANLAEVILRMKAFSLGEIEGFPFIDPPTAASIRGGRALLHELGVLTESQELTPIGRELAGLPIDPTLGRMLLQARREDCLAEMLVIAAGLSVPDPRERPEQKKELANAAHKAFAAPHSDFLSLLRIWQAAPDPESSPRNALRRFCRENYLSFVRMSEWRDLWRQLRELTANQQAHATDTPRPADEARPSLALPQPVPSADQARGRRRPRNPGANPKDDAIHRCILAGHLGHVARHEEGNTYRAGGNRLVTLFPGSNLYDRRRPRPKPARDTASSASEPGTPDAPRRHPAWIVAGEIVHTSRIFARIVARIDPAWAAELGAHLCRHQYGEPHWNAKAGRVLATRRSFLHGLEVDRTRIDYGRIDPEAATRLFIRGALVEAEEPLPHRFDRCNRALRERIEAALSRVRSNRIYGLEDRLAEFYGARLRGISSLHDLARFIREHGEESLVAREDDLIDREDEAAPDLALFPDRIPLGNAVLPVSYAYAPGEEEDGVTVRVPLPAAEHLTAAQVQWAVPGLRAELSECLLRALPKAVRRRLMPIEAKAREIANEFAPPTGAGFFAALAGHVTARYGVEVRAGDWPADCLPGHLVPRVEVVDERGNAIVSGRDLAAIQRRVRRTEVRSDAWDEAVRRFERPALTGWTFGDLAESIVVGEMGGVPLCGYPGLEERDGEVNLRLFRRREDVDRASPAAIRRLAERDLGRDLGWLSKELRDLGRSVGRGKPGLASSGNGSFQDALARFAVRPSAESTMPIPSFASGQPGREAEDHILAHLLRLEPLRPLDESRFRAMCEKARRDLPTTVRRVRDLLAQVQALCDALLASPHRYPGMEDDIRRLAGPGFLAGTPHDRLAHLPRYLQAVRIRAERAAHSPAKDAAKAGLLRPFEDAGIRIADGERETFRWMLEEYRVSIFAQELGTAQPVSAKRLEALLVDHPPASPAMANRKP